MGSRELERLEYAAVFERIRDLFPNMRVISQLYSLLRDPESSLEDAIELIRSDGVLAAGVVRLSNSAYYSTGGQQLDLQSAVQQVGFQATLRLVGDILSRQIFMRDLDGYGMTADEYWTYSYYCAAFMELASRNLRLNADIAYLAGLLHGIGRVVNNEILLEQKVEILWDPTLPAEEWEAVMNLATYPEAGASLLRSWNFPAPLCELVQKQCDPDFLAGSSPGKLLDFARSVIESNRAAIGRARRPWHLLGDHPVYALNGLGREYLEDLHEQALERVTHLQRAL